MKIIKRLIKFRRYLHMYPEIGFDTNKTKKYIIDNINKINYNKNLINLNIIEYYNSLIITLSTKESKILGFRADIDALEIKEENNTIYKSKNNYMHACGHDAHTAVLLYFIIHLLENPNLLNGTIRCIFQTAEEGPGNGGAFYLINHPLIKEIDSIFCFHVNSELEKNTIYYKNDYIMASSTTFKIEVYGKSNHVTKYHDSLDSLKISHNIYNKINNINKDNSIVYICKFNSGITTNIISDYTIMEGTIRTFNINDLLEIKNSLNKIIKEYNNFKIKLTYNDGYPSLKNNNCLVNMLLNSCKNINCNINKLTIPFYLSDDFSRYSINSKICYFILGTKKDKPISLHSNNFDIDEESLYLVFDLYKKIISEYFGDCFSIDV